MHPILFHFSLFGVDRLVTSYGVCASCGVLCALAVCAALAGRRGFSREQALLAALTGIAAGVVGAKAMFLMVSLPDILERGIVPYLQGGGLVFYGGFIAGGAAVAFLLRKWKLGFLPFADLATPALALGHGMGRVGCFLFGCCYGRPTSVPWAVTYPSSIWFQGPSGVPLHPVQLYEAGFEAFAAVLAVLAVRRIPSGRADGAVFALWSVSYGVFRLAMELGFRGDDRGMGTGTFPPSAWVSIALVALGTSLLFRLGRGKAHGPTA